MIDVGAVVHSRLPGWLEKLESGGREGAVSRGEKQVSVASKEIVPIRYEFDKVNKDGGYNVSVIKDSGV